MRKGFVTGLLAVAIVVSAAAGTQAAGGKKMPAISGTFSVDYWMAKENMNIGGSATKANQHFFPVIVGTIDPTKDIVLFAKWGRSDAKAENPPDPPDNSKDKSSLFEFGGKYKFPMGFYAGLSYAQMETKVESATGANDGKVTMRGLRLSGGVEHEIPMTMFKISADLGIGIGNKAKISSVFGSARPKTDRFDMSVKGIYKFGNTGFSAHLGYIYQNFKVKSSALTNEFKVKYKGPIFGVTYGF